MSTLIQKELIGMGHLFILFSFALNEKVKPELNKIYETFNEIASNHELLANLKRVRRLKN